MSSQDVAIYLSSNLTSTDVELVRNKMCLNDNVIDTYISAYIRRLCFRVNPERPEYLAWRDSAFKGRVTTAYEQYKTSTSPKQVTDNVEGRQVDGQKGIVPTTATNPDVMNAVTFKRPLPPPLRMRQTHTNKRMDRSTKFMQIPVCHQNHWSTYIIRIFPISCTTTMPTMQEQGPRQEQDHGQQRRAENPAAAPGEAVREGPANPRNPTTKQISVLIAVWDSWQAHTLQQHHDILLALAWHTACELDSIHNEKEVVVDNFHFSFELPTGNRIVQDSKNITDCGIYMCFHAAAFYHQPDCFWEGRHFDTDAVDSSLAEGKGKYAGEGRQGCDAAVDQGTNGRSYPSPPTTDEIFSALPSTGAFDLAREREKMERALQGQAATIRLMKQLVQVRTDAFKHDEEATWLLMHAAQQKRQQSRDPDAASNRHGFNLVADIQRTAARQAKRRAEDDVTMCDIKRRKLEDKLEILPSVIKHLGA